MSHPTLTRGDLKSLILEAMFSRMFEEEEEELDDQGEVKISLTEDDANTLLGYLRIYTQEPNIDVRARHKREDNLMTVTGEIVRIRDEGGGDVTLEDEREIAKLRIVIDQLEKTSQDREQLRKAGENIKSR
jgi:hypothetical protein